MTVSTHASCRTPLWSRSVLMLGALLIVLMTGCSQHGTRRTVEPLDFIQGWQVEVIASDAIAMPSQTGAAHAAGTDSAYGLYLLTRGGGLNVREGRLHFDTTKDDFRWEHAWLVLESPGTWREIGVTNTRDLMEVYTFEVLNAAVSGQRNPASKLRTRMNTSTVHENVRNGKPDFVLHLPLTADQHARLAQYLERYDYGYYTLDDHNCTSFVSDAARLVGLPVNDRMRVLIPQSISIHGSQPVPLWHDPEFSEFVMATPSVLEQSLRDLVAKGLGEDGHERYLRRRPAPADEAAPAIGATPAARPEAGAVTP